MSALATIPRETSPSIGRLEDIPLELVDVGDNVRDDPGDLTELAASIAELGVLEAVGVTLQPTGRYLLRFGQRRFLASRLAKMPTIRAIVTAASADADKPGARRSIEQLAENLVRKDLNAIEEAVALREVLDSTKGMTQDALAKRLGVSAPWVSNTLNLLDVAPKVQEHVREERLSASHVKALRGLAPKTQVALAKEAVDRGYSAHGLEDAVQRHKQNEEWETERRRRNAADLKAALERLEAGLAKLADKVPIDAPIRIVGYGDKGSLVKAITDAGHTDVKAVNYYGDEGVAKRAETKCDCVAWRVEESYSGTLTIAEGCIVKAHQEAVYATSRAGEAAKQKVVTDSQAAVKELLRLTVHHLPRHARQALLWHAMDYTALEWLKEQRKATKERKLDPWAALSRLSDEELDAMLADHASRQFHDRYGLHLDWTAVATDLGIVEPIQDPAPAAKVAKGKAPKFTASQAAAAAAEMDAEGLT